MTNLSPDDIKLKIFIDEMREDDPRAYKKYLDLVLKDHRNGIILFLIITPIIFLIFCIVFLDYLSQKTYYNSIYDDHFIPILMLIACGFGISGTVWITRKCGHAGAFANKCYIEKQRAKTEGLKMVKKIAKRLSEIEARGIGDMIIAHEGATVINRSIVIKSFQYLKNEEPNVAEAISTIAGFVEHSKSPEAADAFGNLAEAISNKDRNPSKIRAFWRDLVTILPSVSSLASSAATIIGLFEG